MENMTADDAKRRVLVVDDERSLTRLVASYLQRDGYDVECAFDGRAAIDAARRLEPDVVVLDLMLPELDGVEVCRRLRRFSDCYVVMLTARAAEADKLGGLGVGADDYLTKPFSPRELVARVQAMLRRPRTGNAEVATEQPRRRLGPLEIDIPAREVLVDGEPVDPYRSRRLGGAVGPTKGHPDQVPTDRSRVGRRLGRRRTPRRRAHRAPAAQAGRRCSRSPFHPHDPWRQVPDGRWHVTRHGGAETASWDRSAIWAARRRGRYQPGSGQLRGGLGADAAAARLVRTGRVVGYPVGED